MKVFDWLIRIQHLGCFCQANLYKHGINFCMTSKVKQQEKIALSGQKRKMENFLLPDMMELFETNRMSHFLLFYDEFFLQKFNFKDCIFHSVLICILELCKRDGVMKTRLATNIDGYPLR